MAFVFGVILSNESWASKAATETEATLESKVSQYGLQSGVMATNKTDRRSLSIAQCLMIDSEVYALLMIEAYVTAAMVTSLQWMFAGTDCEVL